MPTLTTSGSPTLNGDSTVTINSTGSDRVQAPASLLAANQGWFACRSITTSLDAVGTGHHYFMWADDSTNLMRFYQGTTAQGGGTRFTRREAGSFVESVLSDGSVGADTTYICKWTTTNIGASFNGGVFDIDADTNVVVLSATLFDIGRWSPSASGWLDSTMYWCAAGTGTLSDADASTIHGFGNTDPELTDFPPTAQLTFLWTADDFFYMEPRPLRSQHLDFDYSR